jgi:hypothetical protein
MRGHAGGSARGRAGNRQQLVRSPSPQPSGTSRSMRSRTASHRRMHRQASPRTAGVGPRGRPIAAPDVRRHLGGPAAPLGPSATHQGTAGRVRPPRSDRRAWGAVSSGVRSRRTALSGNCPCRQIQQATPGGATRCGGWGPPGASNWPAPGPTEPLEAAGRYLRPDGDRGYRAAAPRPQPCDTDHLPALSR